MSPRMICWRSMIGIKNRLDQLAEQVRDKREASRGIAGSARDSENFEK